VSDKQVELRDLGSKNGSYVNGQRVEGTCVLESGDQVAIGPLNFEVVIEVALGGLKRPAARDVREVAQRTAAASNEDLDIARWLEDDDGTDVSRAVASPETRQFRIDDTANVMGMETQADNVTETPDDDSAEDGDDKKKSGGRWKKPAPAKLPPRSQQQSKDSREAAADMLKRFFNRS
jgi:pSer/pThr/pTyr-binding forkhead associated (FHA) protein